MIITTIIKLKVKIPYKLFCRILDIYFYLFCASVHFVLASVAILHLIVVLYPILLILHLILFVSRCGHFLSFG